MVVQDINESLPCARCHEKVAGTGGQMGPVLCLECKKAVR